MEARRLADVVPGARVDDAPQGRALRIDRQHRVALGRGDLREHAPDARQRRAGLGRVDIGLPQPVDRQRVARPVDVEVESEREEVIVIDRDGIGQDQSAVSGIGRRGRRIDRRALDGFDLHDAGRADAALQRSGRREDPVHDIVVVAEPDDEASDEFGMTVRARPVARDLVMRPRDVAGRAFENADQALLLVRPAHVIGEICVQ